MITTDRNVFTGFHMDEDSKHKLRIRAAQEGKTMSEWIYDCVVQKLNEPEEPETIVTNSGWVGMPPEAE